MEKDKNVIVAIGGAVIKTAWDEIRLLAGDREFDVLVHNGGSLFHDFQRATETIIGHSYPLSRLVQDPSPNRKASLLVWRWLEGKTEAPEGSLTRICEREKIKVLMFTVPGADFWHLFRKNWGLIGERQFKDFALLCTAMSQPFVYYCLGSAVIHPEVFTKALAVVHPTDFSTHVVDFKEMYRPRTRVANHGSYHLTDHRTFLTEWLDRHSLKDLRFQFQEATGDG